MAKRLFLSALIALFPTIVDAQSFNVYVGNLPAIQSIDQADSIYVLQGGPGGVSKRASLASSLPIGSLTPPTGTLVINGQASVSGSPNLILSNTFGGTGQGGGVLWNSLNSALNSITSGYINCGFGVNTAGSEQGTCDHAVRGPGATNAIITQASNGPTSGCFLCTGNTDNYWSIGSASTALASIFTKTMLATGSGNGVIAVANPSTGADLGIQVQNSGTLSNVLTSASAYSVLTGGVNTYTVIQAAGGASPVGRLFAASGLTGGLIVQSGSGPITLSPATSVVLPAGTGTPVASLCLDASNNIIKKTTAGSCI